MQLDQVRLVVAIEKLIPGSCRYRSHLAAAWAAAEDKLGLRKDEPATAPEQVLRLRRLREVASALPLL
jgi:hypothetical protein